MAKKDEKQVQSKNPGWVEVIQKNKNDLTKVMYQLFTEETLKTNIEEDLKKVAKKSE